MADASPDGGPPGPLLVVGLGNPGARYARNRHNAGYLVADRLAELVGGRFSGHRSRAEVLQGRLPGEGGRPGPRVVVAKPAVFMNESGGPVAGLVRFYRAAPEALLVLHDDLELEPGVIRMRRGGGEGGHNGLRSISRSLGSKDYWRLRLGIGRPPGRTDPADFVLSNVSGREEAGFQIMLAEAVDLVTSSAIAAARDGLNAWREAS